MSHHILLVEDDDHIRKIYVQLLTHAEYLVTPTSDGETALELIEHSASHNQLYDVVVVDVCLNEVSGLDVMYATLQYKPLPPAVILMSGYATVESAIKALRAGASDYLIKPFSPERLIHSIAQALERRAAKFKLNLAVDIIAQSVSTLTENHYSRPPRHETQQPQEIDKITDNERYIQVGELLIDQSNHQVRVNGVLLQVTPNEYDILVCLASQCEHVVSPEELAYAVYGYETITKEAARKRLKTHVYNVRSKMPEGYICTVHGVGYRMVVPTNTSTTTT
jgi:DNA-binding response OmpR family regulator